MRELLFYFSLTSKLSLKKENYFYRFFISLEYEKKNIFSINKLLENSPRKDCIIREKKESRKKGLG